MSKSVDLGTFDQWLAHQKVHPHEKGTFRSLTEGVMISDTTEDWLAKQSVIDQPQKQETSAPVGTMEEWLRKQVSEKMAFEQKEKQIVSPQQT